MTAGGATIPEAHYRGEGFAMPKVRCPYCHERIDKADYPAHEEAHLALRPDGQHSEYVTLPDGEREAGDLAGVPQVYAHRKCGVATRMPEEIVRSYLKNPYLYSADQTFCCGCGKHVPFRACVWTETGEDLQSYTDKLRAAKPEMKGQGCFGVLLLMGVGLSGVAAAALA